MSETREWLRLEVGYVASGPAAKTPAATKQKFFEDMFRESARDKWKAMARTIVRNPRHVHEESWVRDVLEQELQDALTLGREPIRIRDQGRCFLVPQSELRPQAMHLMTGDAGTVCRLVGHEWIDHATYLIENDKGEPWGQGDLPTGHFAIATLVWKCNKP